MASGAFFKVASLVLAAGGAAEQHKQSRQQEAASKKERRLAAAQNAKSVRRTVAESRRLRAQAIAATESAGVGNSSVQSGVTSSIQTQTGSAIGFSNQLASLDRARYKNLDKANTAGNRANLLFTSAGQIGQFG